jgi:hypothetical protein
MGQFRAHLEQLNPRDVQRATAAVLVAALHVGLFFVVINSGGRFDGIHDGETPTTRLVLLLTRHAAEKHGSELPPVQVTDSNETRAILNAAIRPPAPPIHSEEPSVNELPVVQARQEILRSIQSTAVVSEPETVSAAVAMPEQENAALLKQLTRVAELLLRSPHQQVTWKEHGKEYTATLSMQPASHGDELDRAVAQISAEDRGKQLTTLIKLKRLAFSNYTQMIDTWDPMVQLHDDEIVGRLHINSEFNLMYDGRTAPQFLGKVTTAASSFTTASMGRRRDADIFRDGIETRAGRIALPKNVQPLAWTPHEDNAHIERLADETHIEFLPEGGYALDGRHAPARDEFAATYFVAAPGATLHVKGIVRGRVLVYSPYRIVIEGNIRYAHDPRSNASSHDFLGLVSDRTIEIAPIAVTGLGDLEIEAAVYAGRRFLVTDLNVAREMATLRIYGSLAAGSMSATEPRYSTKIEYDARFEETRPPGFPSTNKFAVESWNRQWVERSTQ